MNSQVMSEFNFTTNRKEKNMDTSNMTLKEILDALKSAEQQQKEAEATIAEWKSELNKIVVDAQQAIDNFW